MIPSARSRKQRFSRIRPSVETLERRDAPATGLTPAQVVHAYGFDQATSFGGTPADGRGQTIAIVDAYDDPSIASDLAAFDTRFGLPNSGFTFTKATPEGTPPVNMGWDTEIALDVEWAHAVAPAADILLVEAKSNSLADLLGAVDYAAGQPHVSVVSMSWGTNEFLGETAYDAHFNVPGVTFVAASGDSGSPAIWPAVSPNVVAVGGTSLRIADSAGTYQSETAWGNGVLSPWYGGSGGGYSKYESRPSYQSGVLPTSTKRGAPDVAYDADPNTGFLVLDSQNGGWWIVGGTSAGAPQWAGLVAIANEGRTLGGQGALNGSAQTLTALYGLPTADFHDVTSGSNGGYTAKTGYDLVTGRGSPHADLVISGLVAFNGTGKTATVSGGTPAKGGKTKGATAADVVATAATLATELAAAPVQATTVPAAPTAAIVSAASPSADVPPAVAAPFLVGAPAGASHTAPLAAVATTSWTGVSTDGPADTPAAADTATPDPEEGPGQVPPVAPPMAAGAPSAPGIPGNPAGPAADPAAAELDAYFEESAVNADSGDESQVPAAGQRATERAGQAATAAVLTAGALYGFGLNPAAGTDRTRSRRSWLRDTAPNPRA